MNESPSPNAFTRRQFLHTGLLTSATLVFTAAPTTSFAAVTKPAVDPSHGLKLGMASYSLRKFTLDQAIEMTHQAGLKYICLKDVHLPLNSSAETRREARTRIEAAGLTLLGGGVVYLKNEQEIRDALQYAKEAGMPTLVCAPDPAIIGTLEKLAQEFNIRIAIHNHGPDNNQYPSPLDAFKLVQDRDPHLGICMDVGHTVRLGQDPVDVMNRCAGRLYDFHIKDVTEAKPQGTTTEVGRGVIDIVAVLKGLVAMHYAGHVALEYEAHAENPMPGILESAGYMRGVLAVQ
jgi:inosose dehydratase